MRKTGLLIAVLLALARCPPLWAGPAGPGLSALPVAAPAGSGLSALPVGAAPAGPDLPPLPRLSRPCRLEDGPAAEWRRLDLPALGLRLAYPPAWTVEVAGRTLRFRAAAAVVARLEVPGRVDDPTTWLTAQRAQPGCRAALYASGPAARCPGAGGGVAVHLLVAGHPVTVWFAAAVPPAVWCGMVAGLAATGGR